MNRFAAQGLAAWLVLALWPAMPAWADEAASAAASASSAPSAPTEREQLRRERAAVEARYKDAEIACSKRFVVSSCVNEVQAQRREALGALRQREIALDEAKRRAEAEQSAQRLDAKRAASMSKPEPVPHAVPAANASAPRSASGSASAPTDRAKRRAKTTDEAAAAAAAATRVAAQQRRASEAAAHREAVDRRNAERAARGKKSTPLPVPPAASAASR
jgi:colicin import membrane protein